jgi:SAM-dependent methyltransferase
MTNCFICGQESEFYFRKHFGEYGLGDVDYNICKSCGFVFSKTHVEMSGREWETLNRTYHVDFEDPDIVNSANSPPYLLQAAMLSVLSNNGLISLKNCLDWGSGYGRFSGILDKYFGITISNYDKYMLPRKNFLSASDVGKRKFSAVINSAVFEHVTDRRFLDEINSCVADDGCLVFHTVVCETIPQDPEWFYLLPVHCAFHTNKSMALLMEQWNYSCSIYCPASKMWVLFKRIPENVETIVKEINIEFQTDFIHYKAGFVDYWK